MPAQSLAQFVAETADQNRGSALFELESNNFLQVNLASGMVWIKVGSMVAYTGEFAFEREGAFEQGMSEFFKKTFTGEGARLTKARGTGSLYLADRGKRVTILSLNDESLVVNGEDLLAFQDGIKSEVTMMRKLSAMASGGLFNVRLSGRGVVAVTTHHRPLTFVVTKDRPVFTDPQATVAWSGSLTPEYKTDMQLKTFLGRGSGESFQMKFTGDGFVVVQPYEESGTPGKG
jgi:uncharacterized protein (AIM24 family)